MNYLLGSFRNECEAVEVGYVDQSIWASGGKFGGSDRHDPRSWDEAGLFEIKAVREGLGQENVVLIGDIDESNSRTRFIVYVYDTSVVDAEFSDFHAVVKEVNSFPDCRVDGSLVSFYSQWISAVFSELVFHSEGEERVEYGDVFRVAATLSGCARKAVVLRLLTLDIASTTSALFRGSVTAQVHVDFEVLSGFIPFDFPSVFVYRFRAAFDIPVTGFVVVIASPVRAGFASCEGMRFFIDRLNRAFATVSRQVVASADHDGWFTGIDPFLDGPFFVGFPIECFIHALFFPSIRVDRGFFFTLIMRGVGERASHWRAGRLALGTPRGPAAPILPATVGYFVSSRAGSSAGLASRMGCASSTFGLLVMNIGPLIMMRSALIATERPGMSDALCVCDAPDAIGAVFGPYPQHVSVSAQADMALLTALTNRKMISTISPFGIFDGSTGGFAQVFERPAVADSASVGVCHG